MEIGPWTVESHPTPEDTSETQQWVPTREHYLI